MMRWAAPQDWMCEEKILARTGLSIERHQRLTIESVGELRALAPRVPWIPVLQGWSLGDYLRHVEMYERAGFRLSDEKTVGLGSICRRQGTKAATAIVAALAGRGIRIHAFGAKILGLGRYGHMIQSSDSMAWSYQARRRKFLLDACARDPEVHHANCANCIRWALEWRGRVVAAVGRPQVEMAV